jgi:hypothetical protein
LCWQTVEQQFIPALAIASTVICNFMRKHGLLSIVIITLLYGFSTTQDDKSFHQKNIDEIKASFRSWTNAEIENGHFFAQDSCNTHYYVVKDSLEIESKFGLSVPEDSTWINYYFAYLNSDDVLDALITFRPYQCDGGNASMWRQYQLLVLSEGDKYKLIDNYFDQFKVGPGFFHLDSASYIAVYGTCFEFLDNDSRCCPSIQRQVKIDLDKNEFFYLKE